MIKNRSKSVNEMLSEEDIAGISNYFAMTDSAKYQDAAYALHWLWDEWFENEFDEMNRAEIEAIVDDVDSLEAIERLDRGNRTAVIVEKFGAWVVENIPYLLGNNDIAETDVPAWFYMTYDKTLRGDVYLIRATDHPNDAIASGGFSGVMDIDKLAYTTRWNRTATHRKGGYVFGYTEEDFKKFGHVGGSKKYKYASRIVAFKVPVAVRVWHGPDEEFQAIFGGDQASNIIEIEEFDTREGFGVYNDDTDEIDYYRTLEELFKSDKIMESKKIPTFKEFNKGGKKKVNEAVDNKTYSLLEAAVDLAYLAGVDKFYSGNSRADMTMFIEQAIKFEEAHKGIEWGINSEKEYIEAIEDWYTDNIKK